MDYIFFVASGPRSSFHRSSAQLLDYWYRISICWLNGQNLFLTSWGGIGKPHFSSRLDISAEMKYHGSTTMPIGYR